MRWIIRDISVFLFGCIFASRYILRGQNLRKSEKRTQSVLRLALFWLSNDNTFVLRRNSPSRSEAHAAKTLISTSLEAGKAFLRLPQTYLFQDSAAHPLTSCKLQRGRTRDLPEGFVDKATGVPQFVGDLANGKTPFAQSANLRRVHADARSA
jgi:hypothetical protein